MAAGLPLAGDEEVNQRFWSDGTPIIRDLTEPWGSVPAERWVRVMAEIFAGGLWDASGCARCAEELPISDALQRRIERWHDWHDELDAQNTSYPKPHYWEQRDDMPIAAFNAEGRAIGRALKRLKSLPLPAAARGCATWEARPTSSPAPGEKFSIACAGMV